MKKLALHKALVMMAAISMVNCAGMMDREAAKDKTGMRKVIGEGLTHSTAECPNGGIFALLKESNGGDVDVVARGVISKSAIEGDFDIYTLAGLRHYGFDKAKDYTKAKIAPAFKDVSITFSTAELAEGAEGRAATADPIDPDKPYTMELTDKNILVLDENKGQNTNVSLSEAKKTAGKSVVHSIEINANGTPVKMPIPTPVLGKTVESFGVVNAVTGTEMKFNVEPSTDGSAVYVQFNNQKAKDKGMSFESYIKDVPANGEITVPLEGVPAGTYKMYVAKVLKNETKIGDLDVCIDTSTGIETNLIVADEEKAEK